MALIKVKNLKGTSGKTPPFDYTSWLDFWKKEKGITPKICEVYNCGGNPDLGGHVMKAGKTAKEYILPMCYSCNNKPDDEIFEAWEIDLVPVS